VCFRSLQAIGLSSRLELPERPYLRHRQRLAPMFRQRPCPSRPRRSASHRSSGGSHAPDDSIGESALCLGTSGLQTHQLLMCRYVEICRSFHSRCKWHHSDGQQCTEHGHDPPDDKTSAIPVRGWSPPEVCSQQFALSNFHRDPVRVRTAHLSATPRMVRVRVPLVQLLIGHHR